MDLVESTVKLIEERSTAREELSSCKQNLQHYQELLTALKTNLCETQRSCSKNKEILEINNITKKAFNENCKTIKELFGKVYAYTQQVQESLLSITTQEKHLEELYNESQRRCKHLQSKYQNDVTLLGILDKNSQDRKNTERQKLVEELEALKTKQIEKEEAWSNLMEVDFENKHRTLERLKIDVELIQDKLKEKQEEKTSYSENLTQLKQINEEKKQKIRAETEEINTKLFELQQDAFESFTKLGENYKRKEQLLFEQISANNITKEHDRKCDEKNSSIKDAKKTFEYSQKKLESDITTKEKLIGENEQELEGHKNKNLEFVAGIELLNNKIVSLEDETDKLKNQYELSVILAQDLEETVDKLNKRIGSLTEETESVKTTVTENETKINAKTSELENLEKTPNALLTELESKLQTLKMEAFEKHTNLEKEIQEVGTSNKNTQLKIESLQTELETHKKKSNDLKLANEENESFKKTLQIQCDNLLTKIKKEESLKVKAAQALKLTPQPPLKKYPLPPKPFSQPSKSAIKSQTALKKKRGVDDLDSDSSVDGERMSYAEFIAKKKMMEQNKRAKRSTAVNKR